jgi:hypothetical protein
VRARSSLFGSAARGDGGTRSDLDLLVVRRDEEADEEWDLQLYDAGVRILATTGNRPAWFSITTGDLGRAVAAVEPLVAEWQLHAVHLTGQRLTSLLRRVA